MPSGSRLVASTRSSGHSPSSCSARLALASMTCSQLSRMSTARRSARPSRNRLSASRGEIDVPRSSRWISRSPTLPSTACGTSAPDVTPASSASQMPSGARSTIVCADSAARRVLPAPPGPTSVTSRLCSSDLAMRATSSSRPMKLVSCALRLVLRAAGAGAGASSPRSTARWVCCSSGDGSTPSSSARRTRSRSYTRSASACCPAAPSARTSTPASRSCSGCSAARASSAARSGCGPASAWSTTAVRRRSSRRVARARTASPQSATVSASDAVRHRSRARARVCAAVS